MWIYIILVFIICLFTLRPQFQSVIRPQLPKVPCKSDNIQDLVLLPPPDAVALVKH